MKLKIEQQRNLSNLYTKLNHSKQTILQLCEKYKELLMQMEGNDGDRGVDLRGDSLDSKVALAVKSSKHENKLDTIFKSLGDGKHGGRSHGKY